MKLIVSFGDPNGIGFETFVKSFYVSETAFQDIDFSIVANKDTIIEYIEKCSLQSKATMSDDKLIVNNYDIAIIEIPYVSVNFGKISSNSGVFSYNSLKIATELTIKKEYDALLTLPISKYSMSLIGFNFPGHTEYLASEDNSKQYLMILFNERMKVALATIHMPLRDVAKHITKELLYDKLNAFHNSLILDFGIVHPKIAVLSLNPHAGEFGNIGDEENEIIIPVLNDLQNQLLSIIGPFASDSLFRYDDYLTYDGIFAMYHDQGLIPLKLNSRNGGVNFTAGLSFIRVSPDHGTGFDIAGRGLADPMSTYQAIIWSKIIHNNRQKLNLEKSIL